MMETNIMGNESRRRQGIGVLLGLLALSLSVAACSPPDGGEALAEQVDSRVDTTGARIINVEAIPVSPGRFVDYIRITGEVEAMYDVTVSAEESGVIERFLVEKGSRVRRGQTIAKIDDAVLRGQVQEARSVADVAEEQYQRQRRLWEEEEIGSEIAYLQLKSAADASKARLQVLEARLARTEIKSPVTGIYDEQFVEAGEMVVAGTPVVRVIAVSRVKVVGGVPERFALSVHRGDSARVTFDALTGREFLGTIEFVGTTVDAGNRTFPIEIVLENPEAVIKPRMVANVQVERARLEGVIVVPQQVVLRTENGYQVYVVSDRDGYPVAVARAVELGPSYGNRTVIVSGLEVGDQLITVGQRLVDEGSFVRLVNRGGSQ
ncbi:MAG: efflux RND transporter periplasmic adaptor subunit [Gemmatimonadota bacterium]|nr:MAG: efflux RND transporter periplasmic adaptor subunit [Gemmatimonadota bacterium]